MKEENKKKVIKIVAILFWIVIWQILAMIVGIEVLVPTPKTTFVVLLDLIGEGYFWQSILLSLMRILAGFVAAVCLGSLLAVFTTFVPYSYEIFYPLLTTIKATPVASFIILLVVWSKSTFVPIISVFLMVLPIVWSNVSMGLKSVDHKMIEVAKVYKFGKIKTFLLIYVPACSSYFYSACVMGIGFGWKSGIAAEVISTPQFSIGKNLYNSKIYLETAELFAWTSVIIILSLAVELLFKFLLQRKVQVKDK